MPEVITLAALMAGASLAFGNREGPTFPPGGAGWVWPMPILERGEQPVVSDGWGSGRDGGARRHRGVDVMYRRPANVSLAVARADHGSRAYFVPTGIPILAARAGKVWSAGITERGGAVVIDHGKPWATFYQHLDQIFPWVKKGAPIEAGQPIGTCGFSAIDSEKIRHLHFEVWEGGAGDHAIDPEPRMRTWGRVTLEDCRNRYGRDLGVHGQAR